MGYDLLSRLKAKFGKARQYNNYLYFCCPTCSAKDSKKMKRYLNVRTLMSSCWICEQPLSINEILGDDALITQEDRHIKEEVKTENPKARIIPCRRPKPINELDKDHPAIKFLNKDHLFKLDDYYNKYGIIYCPSDVGEIFCYNPFISSADRIIFPVKFKNELVGWQMRSIPGTTYGDRPDVVKYYHLFNKGSYLYNYDQAKKYQMVVLVEGVKKALKLPMAVATLGKHVTGAQAQLLQEWRDIVIMLDAEPSAQEIGKRLERDFRMNGRRTLNIDLSRYGLQSPDEATTEQLTSILAREWQ